MTKGPELGDRRHWTTAAFPQNNPKMGRLVCWQATPLRDLPVQRSCDEPKVQKLHRDEHSAHPDRRRKHEAFLPASGRDVERHDRNEAK